MNKKQKEVELAKLKDEEKELKQLKAIYNKAAEDITNKIKLHNGKINVLLSDFDNLDDTEKSILQSQIYQKGFQKSLQSQINGFLNDLNSKQYASVGEYLNECYETGYIGNMYDLHYQGIPVVTPIDQKQVVKAMTTDSKISKKLYTKLGEDVDFLKKRIASNLSRGIATGSEWKVIARNIAADSNVGFNRAMRIARTEGHRIQVTAADDAQHAAKKAGADVVKQWDAALDGRTRTTHRKLDGQIRELDEPFEVDGMEVMRPSGFGRPEEDINCRCALLQRARWALDEDELQTLKDRAAYFGLDKTKDFEEFKQKYLKAADVQPQTIKKEYLTEKKLKEKLTDADKELADLYNQFEDEVGITFEEAIETYGGVDEMFHAVHIEMVKDMGNKEFTKWRLKVMDIKKNIDAVELQKIDWQTKLDKKIATKEIKNLKKEKIQLQDELDNFTVKTYSGIWKDDVSTSDWFAKSGSIQAKKDYFNNKLLYTTGDEAEKFKKLLKDLEDFDTNGSKYYKIESRIKKIDSEVVKLKLGKQVKNEAFTDARKDAALWFDKAHGGFAAADKYFDPKAQQIHAAASTREHNGFYTYTQASGGHNRPLAGFQKPWSKSGSGWEEEFFVGSKKVWIDFEGKGEAIRGLTTLIQKSTYDHDVWLQSGQDFQTIEAFLGINYGTLSKMSDAELENFVGKRNVIYNFISSAVNEGGGSIFNGKPLKINFYAPEGTQMLYASDAGAFGKGENEMILQRGGTYEVSRMYWGIDHTDGNRRKIFVDMEIHPEEGYDLFQQDPDEWKGSKKNYHD